MLHPDLRDPGRVAELQAAWAETGNLRLDPFLDPQAALALRDALRGLPHELTSEPVWQLGFQYFRYPWQPQADCDHVTCAFGRWWRGEGAAWLGRLAGRALVSNPGEQLQASLYGKGCFLEWHNDHDGVRQVAYVVGLTEQRWDPADGGHLEFLHGGQVTRRAPGWGTLDLFDVSVEATAPVHRIPLMTQAHERRAFLGWLVRPEDATAAPG